MASGLGWRRSACLLACVPEGGAAPRQHAAAAAAAVAPGLPLRRHSAPSIHAPICHPAGKRRWPTSWPVPQTRWRGRSAEMAAAAAASSGAGGGRCCTCLARKAWSRLAAARSAWASEPARGSTSSGAPGGPRPGLAAAIPAIRFLPARCAPRYVLSHGASPGNEDPLEPPTQTHPPAHPDTHPNIQHSYSHTRTHTHTSLAFRAQRDAPG